MVHTEKEELELLRNASKQSFEVLYNRYSGKPALQFYGGNFFEGKDKGKYGEVYNYRTSYALETQHYPDSPNHANFPSTVLNPGETYHHICVYKFEIVE